MKCYYARGTNVLKEADGLLINDRVYRAEDIIGDAASLRSGGRALRREASERNSFGSTKITVSVNATERVENWPNKKRSRRLIKKMTKRLGPQVSIEPAAYVMTGGRMAVHPKIYEKMKQGGSHE